MQNLSARQRTVGGVLEFSGIGVHSGADVTAIFNPAEAGTGIIFQRIGPNGESTDLKAVSASVGSTDLCTVLGFSAS